MLQMKLCGDLVLREKCAPVDEITPELLEIMDEMVKMMDEQRGVGLAAPQVGISKRFLVMRNPSNNKIMKLINPVILSRSEETIVKEEGCLSVLGPDGLPVYADVERPAKVTVQWTDIDGKQNVTEMSGFRARIVQHETDHLDGILFIDHLSPVKREMVMSKVRRRK